MNFRGLFPNLRSNFGRGMGPMLTVVDVNDIGGLTNVSLHTIIVV